MRLYFIILLCTITSRVLSQEEGSSEGSGSGSGDGSGSGEEESSGSGGVVSVTTTTTPKKQAPTEATKASTTTTSTTTTETPEKSTSHDWSIEQPSQILPTNTETPQQVGHVSYFTKKNILSRFWSGLTTSYSIGSGRTPPMLRDRIRDQHFPPHCLRRPDPPGPVSKSILCYSHQKFPAGSHRVISEVRASVMSASRYREYRGRDLGVLSSTDPGDSHFDVYVMILIPLFTCK